MRPLLLGLRILVSIVLSCCSHCLHRAAVLWAGQSDEQAIVDLDTIYLLVYKSKGTKTVIILRYQKDVPCRYLLAKFSLSRLVSPLQISSLYSWWFFFVFSTSVLGFFVWIFYKSFKGEWCNFDSFGSITAWQESYLDMQSISTLKWEFLGLYCFLNLANSLTWKSCAALVPFHYVSWFRCSFWKGREIRF